MRVGGGWGVGVTCLFLVYLHPPPSNEEAFMNMLQTPHSQTETLEREGGGDGGGSLLFPSENIITLRNVNDDLRGSLFFSKKTLSHVHVNPKLFIV